MADPSEEYMLQDRCYYLPRDFEYAQILYDLAFLLEIDALVLNQAPPKYRIFSLFNAAQGIDGYSSDIALWLKGSLKDNDLAYLPSSRIKKYLKSIDAIGTIDELNELLKKTGYFRCLRLRSLRGLGKTRIAESVTMTSPSEQWLADASVSTGLSKDAILSIINDKIPHSWQTPHVIPPLLRLLHDVEDLSETRLRYSLDGIKSVFEPIVSEVSVRIAAETPTQIERLVRKALKGQKMFTEKPSNNKGGICIVHRMGWSAFIYDECDTGVYSSIENIARSFDPLSLAPSGLLKGDLHVHSAWSDGISSISSIVEAGSALGYEYIAITDHSRSSKIQGGLTPAEWLQQAGSIAKQKPAISVLHGIEVDILKDGELDLPLNILNAADIVVASVHSGWSSDQVENTASIAQCD